MAGNYATIHIDYIMPTFYSPNMAFKSVQPSNKFRQMMKFTVLTAWMSICFVMRCSVKSDWAAKFL